MPFPLVLFLISQNKAQHVPMCPRAQPPHCWKFYFRLKKFKSMIAGYGTSVCSPEPGVHHPMITVVLRRFGNSLEEKQLTLAFFGLDFCGLYPELSSEVVSS